MISDMQRIELTKQAYVNYEIGKSIFIEGLKNRLYVSEFKDKATGEQTYVVTDKRLGENPSIMELASVKK